MKTSDYIGRFAPSPTGHLHFGSLLAATASYLDAKSHAGTWLVRMEDLDPPREQAGAAQSILDTLFDFGLEWDGDVVYQSQRTALYEQAIRELHNQVYACHCTRKAILNRCSMGQYGAVYDGHCRELNLATLSSEKSRRLITKGHIRFTDAIQGDVHQNLETQVGDFHLIRRDGLFAYHLGVVVDDYAQGITHIVRGFDLLDSTARQIYLMHCLNYPTPHYAHIPLATYPDAQKLSKQTAAKPLEASKASQTIVDALSFLGQNPPKHLHTCDLQSIWQWGIEHWQLNKVPKTGKLETAYI